MTEILPLGWFFWSSGLVLGWFWAGFGRQETHQPRRFGPIRLVLGEKYRRTFNYNNPFAENESVAAAILEEKIRKIGRIGPNVRGKWLSRVVKPAQESAQPFENQPSGPISP